MIYYLQEEFRMRNKKGHRRGDILHFFTKSAAFQQILQSDL